MKKYGGLLLTVSQQYHISKGERETEDEWKIRLVYSICGMMAYASLWDEAEEPVSIVHLKRRIRSQLANCKSMYPELSESLPHVPEELEDEVANQFLRAGVVYHCPNRIAPSMKHEEAFGNILFQRGVALNGISCVSGIGFYSKRNVAATPGGITAMFGLEQENLRSLWHATLSAASWTPASFPEYGTEYLRLKPPFSHGYWENKPDMTDTVSILRTGMPGSQVYYLYHHNGSVLEVSPLSQWQVGSHNYRLLACACLSACGTLPPIEYAEDGALVHIRMKYLLPPHELEFLKLYSWPETCTSLPCDFRRKLSAEVFWAIKGILSETGYEFEGGTT